MLFKEGYNNLYTSLRSWYQSSGRYYHNWQHIVSLLTLLDEVQDYLKNPDAVQLAIYYHDAIYDPLASDNEVKSAELLNDELAGVFEKSLLEYAAKLILTTTKHRLPAEEGASFTTDCAYFLDMDISILGADLKSYDKYEEGIAKEYSMIPPEVFKPARQAVMRRFLEREHIFYTSYFRDQFENAARLNIARAISALS